VEWNAAGRDFRDGADQRLRQETLEQELTRQIKEKPGLAVRLPVELSGGAIFWLTTLLNDRYKDKGKKMEIEINDIKNYIKLARSAPDATLLQKGIKRDRVIVAAEILTALATAFRFEGETLTYDTFSKSSWLVAALKFKIAVRPSPQLLPASWPAACVPRMPSQIDPCAGVPLAVGEGNFLSGAPVVAWPEQARGWGPRGISIGNRFRPFKRRQPTFCAGR
jgi:hypothetical protein